MPILKLKDTESLRADPLEEIFRFGAGVDLIPFLSELPTFEISYEQDQFKDEGINKILTSTVTLKSAGTLTNQRIVALTAQIDGLNVVTHRTSIITPETDDDPNTFNYNAYANDIFSYYNLKNVEYEDHTSLQSTSETLLPNYCLGALWSRGEATPEQKNYYTYFGEIQSLEQSDMLAGQTPINNFEFDDEFLEFDAFLSPDYETRKDYFKNLVVSGNVPAFNYSSANQNVFVDFTYGDADSEKIGNTPFFNRIRLPGKDYEREDDPSTPNIDETDVYRSTLVKAFRDSSMTDKLIKTFRRSNSSIRNFRINQDNVDIKVYDLMESFESIGYGTTLAQADEMYLRSIEQNYAIDDNSPFTFYFYKLLLLGKIRRLQFAYAKSFRQLIFEGQEHRNEQVGFKVIKRRQGTTTPIQTFYFLNRAGLNDFIDTQIKFDVTYSYEIIGMFAIFGSNYTYEDVTRELDPSGTFNVRLTFVNRPSVKIAEVPLFTKITRIVEPPPITPEIVFYNEMTSRNKVKIRLEHQDGNIVDEYSQKPLRPFGNNQGYIGKLKQYFGGTNDVLVKSGKTSDGTYEIYRLEEPPSSYSDFENALLATVKSNQVFANGEVSKSVMYTDMIKHQKKYYYTFRTLTHRGNPSELSEIYVVEMYEDADETFLTFDLYEIPEIEKEQNTYSMRKFIQIKPNFAQTITNETELINGYGTAQAAVPFLKVGSESLEENIWDFNNPNKYIKLRLESKNSGRKMDLNLYFKIKK